MKRSVHWFGSLVIVLAVLSVLEVSAWLTSTYIARTSGIPFYLPHVTESYEHYQARLTPTLGWPSPEGIRERSDFYDASGSRLIPAFPDPTRYPTCVSLYGDSFTEAVGVDHEHAWSNVLSRLLNCRVANYGVAGYGTDQAYLRYLGNSGDRAKVVVLGYLAENIQRNVNQFRNLLGPSSQCITKPRFILNAEGQLTLVPIPALSPKDFATLQQNPGLIFTHDIFVPGGLAGFQKASFPYSWRILQTSGILLKRLLWHVQPYMELYQPGNPSQALEVTAAIIEAFCRTARERGQHPLVLVIPTVADVFRYLRHQGWIYQPLVDRLAERKVEYLDMGPLIIKYLNGANPKTIYAPEIHYHFDAAGNRFLARTVFDYLTSKNLLR
jgi:hypothetical protein